MLQPTQASRDDRRRQLPLPRAGTITPITPQCACSWNTTHGSDGGSSNSNREGGTVVVHAYGDEFVLSKRVGMRVIVLHLMVPRQHPKTYYLLWVDWYLDATGTVLTTAQPQRCYSHIDYTYIDYIGCFLGRTRPEVIDKEKGHVTMVFDCVRLSPMTEKC